MGIFDKLSGKKNSITAKYGENASDAERFSLWLNAVLAQNPPTVGAVNFNLYEGSNNAYYIQFIVAEHYDPNDSDWACNEIFSSGDNIFEIVRSNEISQWEQGIKYITNLVEVFLKSDCGTVLKNYEVVGLGFVDGDIIIIYQNPGFHLES